MKYTLYGDGIHDDYPAIQEMLDTLSCEVRLPAPEKNYAISRTLKIHSCQTLVLPRFARIRLLPHSDCYMATNADYENGNVAVGIQGGIWDYANQDQYPNPMQTAWIDPQTGKEPEDSIHVTNGSIYQGYLMYFFRVQNLELSDMTFKDPANFCAALDTVSYFSVQNILFDFNHGNPTAVNMDGIHINGHCHHGVIRNLKGSCYDDLVALNADEGSDGDISDIEIDGIFSEDCHSAVRLLTVRNRVENVHISNVYGTFYQYCIGVTNYYYSSREGLFDGLHFDHIYASKAVRYSFYCKDGSYEYPIIYFDKEVRVGRVTIRDLVRREKVRTVPTIAVQKDTVIHQLILDNIVTENEVGGEMPLIDNQGCIEQFEIRHLEEH